MSQPMFWVATLKMLEMSHCAARGIIGQKVSKHNCVLNNKNRLWLTSTSEAFGKSGCSLFHPLQLQPYTVLCVYSPITRDTMDTCILSYAFWQPYLIAYNFGTISYRWYYRFGKLELLLFYGKRNFIG